MVVLCHTWLFSTSYPTAWGWVGISLHAGVVGFFAISAFLIYRPFVAAHAAGRAPTRVRDHARRRTLRIVPAYWVALVVLSIWPGTDGDILGSGGWRHFLLVQNLSRQTVSDGLIIAWSLCVEVSFYALVPLLAWAVRRAARRFGRPWWHAELAAIGAFAAMSAVSIYLIAAQDLTPALVNTLLTTSLWFAPGMALAVMSVAVDHGGARAERIRAWLAGHAGLLWATAAVAVVASARVNWALVELRLTDVIIAVRLGYVVNIGLLMVFGGCLLAPIVAGARGRVAAVTTWRPLMALGLVSYGVFLWHAVLGRWLAYHTGVGLFRHFVPLTLVTLAWAIAVATVSYRLVELPFLRLKYRRRRRRDGLRRR